MTKTRLQNLAHLSSASIAKLGKNENVTTDILVKICGVLKCDITEILELEKTDFDNTQENEDGN